jgi:hypothetical protein
VKGYQGPTRFSDEYRRDELERTAREVERIAGDVATELLPEKIDAYQTSSPAAVRFGLVTRLQPSAAMVAILPRATEADAGEWVAVIISSSAAAVTFRAAGGATINRADTFAPGAAIGVVRFLWDGAEWWT